MRMRMTVALALIAATSLSGARVSETFDQDCPDCWPGWEVVQDPESGRQISVAEDAGRITIEGISFLPDVNVQHLLWTEAAGASAARAEIAFTGSQGTPKWSYLLSAPPWGIPCYGADVPPVVADEALCLTLYDDGPNWIGACPGAPPAMGLIRWAAREPPRLFIALMLMQSIAGEVKPLGLPITIVPAAPMYERLDFSVSSDGISACAHIAGLSSPACRALKEPPVSGTVGIYARTSQSSVCTPSPLRDFEVYRVEVI